MAATNFTTSQLLQWLGYLSKGQFETLQTKPVPLESQVYRKADLVTVSDLVYRTTHQGQSLTVCYFNHTLFLFKDAIRVEFTQGSADDVH